MVTDTLFNGLYKGKKVLITGHTGFKGSWLCLLLHRLGASVYGYSLNPPTEPSLYKMARVGDFVVSKTGDIRDLASLTAFVQEVAPDIVIHMAAQSLVRLSYREPIETYTTNVIGTLHVFEAVRKAGGVKVVLNITTDKCYENKEWPWGYRENEPMGGYDPYSNSKACSELLTASYRNSFFNPTDYANHGVALASARAGNVIGGGDWAQDRLIPDFIRAILQGEKVTIRSPKAIRPWQHVLEPLSGYLTLCARLYQEGPLYAEGWNFGPDDNDAKPVEWIINEICTMWGNGASYTVDANPQLHEAHYLKLDCSKAKSQLQWHPRWSISMALSQIVGWTRAYQDNRDIQAETFNQIEHYFS